MTRHNIKYPVMQGVKHGQIRIRIAAHRIWQAITRMLGRL